MFYIDSMLSKSGPLGSVWLSSTTERKVNKSQILQSDITSSIETIMDQSRVPKSLRLSGQLLLGVVRIYGRKARYLMDDCNEALLRIKMVRRVCIAPTIISANTFRLFDPGTIWT